MMIIANNIIIYQYKLNKLNSATLRGLIVRL